MSKRDRAAIRKQIQEFITTKKTHFTHAEVFSFISDLEWCLNEIDTIPRTTPGRISRSVKCGERLSQPFPIQPNADRSRGDGTDYKAEPARPTRRIRPQHLPRFSIP